MPPLPPVPSVLKVILGYTGPDTDAANILHFHYTGAAPTTAAMNALATDISTAWNAHLAAGTTFEYNLTSVETIDLASATGASGLNTTSHIGTDTNPIMSAQAAFVVKKKIARRYRGGHGKTFLPPPGAVNLNDLGHWTASFVTNNTARYVAFIAAIVAQADVPIDTEVQVSYYSGFTNVTTSSGRMKAKPTLRVSPVVDTVTSVLGDSRVGSQRRRNGT